ncbi:MAG TPA: SUMF1/EgtB/PvdO family nonheme iron enzyme, partial [Kofleriaceae bacterium]|nr:SUMF1/EgtB/PvdO family nonheme iron enzyme [Kofleriaceae bacterium]
AKGVRFQTDALVAALASSVAEQPGALPLLSFALAELWQRRDLERGVIPAAALEAIGGVAGGLARHADAVIGALGPAERIAARRIALRLVTADDTRAERDRGELCPDEDPAAAAALEAMIRGRLVAARHTAAGPPVYELAHDSLITAWSTLQAWCEGAAGQRALRTRLAAAADDWHRLGRRRDALWNRAQLAEAAALDELSGGDRAFLAASRAAARDRRIARIALAASLPAVAVATALVLQHRGRAARDREIAAHLAAADPQLAAGQRARDAARRDRGEAFRRFDAARDDAEPTWRAALAALATARAGYDAAARELELALLSDTTRDDVRARMAAALDELATLAELAGDPRARDELVGRLAAFDTGGQRTAAWNAPAALAIAAPGAARIAVRGYADRDGRLELGPTIAHADRPRLDVALPAGSYAVELTGGDGLIVHDPVQLARGEAMRLDVPLPRAADVPPGLVYVPAGRFLTGDASGNDDYRVNFLAAAPLHPVTTAAYLIGRTEVTFGDWIAYLRALSPAEREARRPRGSSIGGITLRLDGGGPGEPFTLVIQPGVSPLVAREGEPLVYAGRTARREIRWETAPVSGISFDDARAYAAWLARAGRVPGARLCTEREWERAARGADGRIWAHGNRIDPDDANLDVTYHRDVLSWGPDPVGAHPASTSPFGLVDTVGNVWEWVEPAPSPTPGAHEATVRGGSWFQGNASAQAANREQSSAEIHSSLYGLRICATPR